MPLRPELPAAHKVRPGAPAVKLGGCALREEERLPAASDGPAASER